MGKCRPLDKSIRPLGKSEELKIIFLISQPKHNFYYVVGTQKNRLNETVVLSTQNMLKLMGKKINTILSFFVCLSRAVGQSLDLF